MKVDVESHALEELSKIIYQYSIDQMEIMENYFRDIRSLENEIQTPGFVEIIQNVKSICDALREIHSSYIESTIEWLAGLKKTIDSLKEKRYIDNISYSCANFQKLQKKQDNACDIDEAVDFKSVVNSVFETQTQHRPLVKSYSEAINAIVDDIKRGSGKEITFDEAKIMRKAIEDFSGSEYPDIRKAYGNPNSQYHKEMEALDEYIKGAPKWEGKIYRGINISFDTANDILSKAYVDMKGPSSWSSNYETAEGFAKFGNDPVHMLFIMESNVSGVSISHLSAFNGIESEVTAPSGVKYYVDNVEKTMVDGMHWFYVWVHENS